MRMHNIISFWDNARYDLIIDDGENLKKVQIKYADSKEGDAWRCICVSSTNHTTNKNLHKYENDVDIIAFYLPELDECIMFNIFEILGKTKIHVRNIPPINNQTNVTYIKDHTFNNYFEKINKI